jgi:hypothetical protein
MAFLPPSREHSFYEQDMLLYVTFTLHATRVERWIRRVKEHYLDTAPTKCLG